MSSAPHIDPSARIGAGTDVGPFAVVGAGVVVGAECRIGPHVVLHEGAVVGDGVRIDGHASVGKQPMRAANSAATRADRQPPAEVGDRCLIGTGAVVYAGCRLGTGVLVADGATVREDVVVGDYTIIGRGAAVENACRIGRYCKLETNAYLTAHSVLEDRVFLAPGVLTSNDSVMGRPAGRPRPFAGVTVRRGGRLGVGAVVLPGREVRADAVVAAGAVLTRDAEGGVVHVGVPARAVRPVPEAERLDRQGWADVSGAPPADAPPEDRRPPNAAPDAE